MKWMNILKNDRSDMNLVEGFNAIAGTKHDISDIETVIGKIEDFLIEWDAEYTHPEPPTYKEHMTEDYVHPKLEGYRKIWKDYTSQ
jgi:hypothetical protein